MTAELKNTMTAPGGEEFLTDFGRKEARRIQLSTVAKVLPSGAAVELVISASHSKGGQYVVQVFRTVVSDGIMTTRLRLDSYSISARSEGSRFSAKNLEKVALEYFQAVTGDLDTRLRMFAWANEIEKEF